MRPEKDHIQPGSTQTRKQKHNILLGHLNQRWILNPWEHVDDKIYVGLGLLLFDLGGHDLQGEAVGAALDNAHDHVGG
jgi:hypothetical protein